MKKALLYIAALVMGSVFLAGCESSGTKMAEQKIQSVTGTIAYRERILLPDDAKVTVSLQDVSKMDAPAEVIAKQQFITNGHQVPLTFDLSYDSSKIQPKHRYTVSARIEVNGKLRFITDTSYGVITDGDSTKHVDMRLVGVSSK